MSDYYYFFTQLRKMWTIWFHSNKIETKWSKKNPRSMLRLSESSLAIAILSKVRLSKKSLRKLFIIYINTTTISAIISLIKREYLRVPSVFQVFLFSFIGLVCNRKNFAIVIIVLFLFVDRVLGQTCRIFLIIHSLLPKTSVTSTGLIWRVRSSHVL